MRKLIVLLALLVSPAVQATPCDPSITDPTNIQSYGFCPANSGSVNSANWVAARNAGVRSLFIPDGTYLIDSPMILPSAGGITLTGQSKTGVTIKAATAGTPLSAMIQTDPGAGDNNFGSTVSNITFDGGESIDFTKHAAAAIKIITGKQFTLDNLIIKRIATHGTGIIIGQPSATGIPSYGHLISNISMEFDQNDYKDPINIPDYGIYCDKTATDNQIVNLIVKNVSKAGYYQAGSCGWVLQSHVYGYPYGNDGTLDYRPDYGFQADIGYFKGSQLQVDGAKKATYYLKGLESTITGSIALFPNDNNDASAFKLENVTRTIIIGNVIDGRVTQGQGHGVPFEIVGELGVGSTVEANSTQNISNTMTRDLLISLPSSAPVSASGISAVLDTYIPEKYGTVAFRANGVPQVAIRKNNDSVSGQNLQFVTYSNGNARAAIPFEIDRYNNRALFGTPPVPTPITVANLPTCNSVEAGAIASVKDGAAAIAWGSAVTGGGSTYYQVFCNGANWTVAGK